MSKMTLQEFLGNYSSGLEEKKSVKIQAKQTGPGTFRVSARGQKPLTIVLPKADMLILSPEDQVDAAKDAAREEWGL